MALYERIIIQGQDKVVEISDWTVPSVWQIDWSGPNTSFKTRRCDKSSVTCDDTRWFFDRKKVLEA